MKTKARGLRVWGGSGIEVASYPGLLLMFLLLRDLGLVDFVMYIVTSLSTLLLHCLAITILLALCVAP